MKSGFIVVLGINGVFILKLFFIIFVLNIEYFINIGYMNDIIELICLLLIVIKYFKVWI